MDDSAYLSTEIEAAYTVTSDDDQPVLESISEHAVTVEDDPDTLLITEGEQGPPGLSAFADWLARNPGGTWEQFMSELGSGAIWQESEW